MMLEQKTTDFLESLSSSQPVPGGGGACAAVGAFSSALGMMVANLTVGKKKYASVEAEIIEVRTKLERVRDQLAALTDRDAQAFAPLAKAYSLPKETKEQQEEKERVMEAALYEAEHRSSGDHENRVSGSRAFGGVRGKGQQAGSQRRGGRYFICKGCPGGSFLKHLYQYKNDEEQRTGRTSQSGSRLPH